MLGVLFCCCLVVAADLEYEYIITQICPISSQMSYFGACFHFLAGTMCSLWFTFPFLDRDRIGISRVLESLEWAHAILHRLLCVIDHSLWHWHWLKHSGRRSMKIVIWLLQVWHKKKKKNNDAWNKCLLAQWKWDEPCSSPILYSSRLESPCARVSWSRFSETCH